MTKFERKLLQQILTLWSYSTHSNLLIPIADPNEFWYSSVSRESGTLLGCATMRAPNILDRACKGVRGSRKRQKLINCETNETVAAHSVSADCQMNEEDKIW